MKRLKILIITILLVVCSGRNVEASKIKNVDVKVVKVTNKCIEMNVKNNRRNSIYISQDFVLKKKIKSKWKKVKFKENAKFAKTITVLPNEKRLIKIKWKKYFGKNLKKGNYKIIFIKTRRFYLK